MLCAFCNTINAQHTISDQTAILQKCIDLPELQKYCYQTEGSFQEPVVLLEEFPQPFPKNSEVTKFGQKLNYISSSELDEMLPTNYFQFLFSEILETQAEVSFAFYHNVNGIYKKIEIDLTFLKEKDNWLISEKKIKE